jgi:hypothetical protein
MTARAPGGGNTHRNLTIADIVERTGIDNEMIDRLVRAFYARARLDPLLGPIFERNVGTFCQDARFLVVGRADERPLPWPTHGGAFAFAHRHAAF